MSHTIRTLDNLIFTAALLLGLMAVFWMGMVFFRSSALALTVILIIGGVYAIGVIELIRFRHATRTLSGALSKTEAPVPVLSDWLHPLDASLRNAVRARVEGERVGLPTPVLTPYLAGLLVMLGLLGTFIGMVDTLQGALIALEGTTELSAIRAGLAAPIRGLGMAFGTSVAGVATSAMLGLMSTLSRRDRMLATRQLDTLIPTVFINHSRVRARQEAYEAMKFQAGALPEMSNRIGAMAVKLEHLAETLAAGQDRFHASVSAVFSELAVSIDRTHKQSLSENARLAGETIKPIVRDVMASIAEETRAVQRHLTGTAQAHLEAMSGRLTETADRVNRSLETAFDAQSRTNDRVMDQLRRTTEDRQNRFEQAADAMRDRLNAMAAELVLQWRQAGAETAARQAEMVSAHNETLAAITGDLRAASTRMRDDTERLLTSSEALIQTRIDSEADWMAAHRDRMDDLAQGIASALLALRQDEERRGDAAVARLARLESALADHLAALGSALEAPMTRLMQTAAEAPRAAADVIAHLRREGDKLAERDTRRLADQERILVEIDTLSRSLAQALTDQHAAINALVESSRLLLDQSAQRFSTQIDAEAARFSESAELVAGSAVDIASLGDAFGTAVTLFCESNEQMAENLRRIEQSLETAAVRSDDQLAYYVAQARDVIDLCMLSQKEIVADLRKLQHASAMAATA